MKKRISGFLLACSFAVCLSGMAFAEEDVSEAVAEESEMETEAAEVSSETGVTGNGAELSEDLYSFQLKLDGEIYQFPMSYAEFTELGWEYEGDESEEIEPNSYLLETFTRGALECYARIANLGINTVSVSESVIAGMSIDSYQFEESTDTVIEFPGGISYGVSALEDVKDAYGEPSDTYEGELYTQLTYQYDYYQEIKFYIDSETGLLNEFDLENFESDSEANAASAAEVSDEPTEEVLAYTAPTELGDDLQSAIVEFAGDLYQIPAPVSVFIENGWTLDEEDSDSVVSGKSFGWVTLRKDNQQMRTTVRNYNSDAAVIENCFITSVEGNVNDTNLPITVQKGISMGMTQEELLAALDGVDYELDDSGDTFAYYTVQIGDSSLDEVEILVNKEEGTVTGIEVSYEPDELS